MVVRSSALVMLLFAGCMVRPYEPFLVAPLHGLPVDAFARCCDLFVARQLPIIKADAGEFRLQTNWGPIERSSVMAQQRATIFRTALGLGLIVEVRYLRQGWFATLPGWTEPRPDAALEHDLGDALIAALSAFVPVEVVAPGPPSR